MKHKAIIFDSIHEVVFQLWVVNLTWYLLNIWIGGFDINVWSQPWYIHSNMSNHFWPSGFEWVGQTLIWMVIQYDNNIISNTLAIFSGGDSDLTNMYLCLSVSNWSIKCLPTTVFTLKRPLMMLLNMFLQFLFLFKLPIALMTCEHLHIVLLFMLVEVIQHRLSSRVGLPTFRTWTSCHLWR